MNENPEKITGFRCYDESGPMLGVVDAKLPDVEFLSEEVSGAGIAGSYEAVVEGHTKPLTLGMKFRTQTASALDLAGGGPVRLELRGSIQVEDAAAGKLRHVPLRAVCRGRAKKAGGGKLEVGKAMDAEHEFDLTYYKLELDGKERLEIDKLNYIHRVGGKDLLADIRNNLGF